VLGAVPPFAPNHTAPPPPHPHTHPSPPKQALIHGLNRHYYSIGINYRKNELEEGMLLNLSKKAWSSGLMLGDFEQHAAANEKTVEEMKALAARWVQRGRGFGSKGGVERGGRQRWGRAGTRAPSPPVRPGSGSTLCGADPSCPPPPPPS
jgi:hypothetical protein